MALDFGAAVNPSANRGSAEGDPLSRALQCGLRPIGAREAIFMNTLPIWLMKLPIWLIIFILLYAVAILYAAIRYRELRKFLAGAFFVSSGILWYLWATGITIPLVMPYVGIVSVETPDISGQRAIVHFILFLLCFYFGFISKPKETRARDQRSGTRSSA
jgi:hypothetical protein